MATDGSRTNAGGVREAGAPLSESQQAAIMRLQKDENIIPAPVWLSRQAYLANDNVERAHADRDPDAFWAERAKLVDWMEPYQEVSRFDPPRHEWFVGGKLNVTVNCIDRHVYSERRNKAALIWVGEDGEEQTYTYGRLYREVNRLANTLKRLGLGKGDRVIIYMPLTPAVRDRDGYFAVLGRSDDVMNVAGHRIGTADVEGALARHPAVAEAAVVGLPDPLKGERIKAFVVLRPGIVPGHGLIASLKDHVRQDLGPIATPSEIEIRDSLPKTRSGKIVRRYLKAVAMGEDPGDLSTLAD